SQYLNLTKNSSLALLVGYMDVTGTLMGITLNQTGKEFETLFLGMAFYLTVSLAIAALMNLYSEQVRLVERTSSIGMGLSFLGLFDRLAGARWELLRKGDAQMKPGYGIRGALNLVVLFYAASLLALLHYTFLADITLARPSYFVWPFLVQVSTLLMVALGFATLVTSLFKNGRFLDLAVLEFVVFLFAVLVGWPFGQLVEGIGGPAVVLGGLVIRLAIIAYTAQGTRPNLTFFHR